MNQKEGRCGAPPGQPAAFYRGGSIASGVLAGPFSLTAGASTPIWGGGQGLGFRCARERHR
jgi:hypothetical protein